MTGSGRSGAESEKWERLEERMDAVGRLTADLFEEFNDVFTATLSASESIGDVLRADHPEMSGDLDDLQNAARHGVERVGRLLAITNRSELARGPVHLGRTVSALAPTLRTLLPGSVDLDVVVSGDEADGGLWCSGDPTALQEVVLNLVTNARDAMPGGGRLAIEVRPIDGERRAEQVEMIVRDEGVGMDAAVRGRAFDPYFSTKREGGGSGLGLTAVYALVRRMEGSLSLTSEPGAGTEVRVVLPACGRPEESNRLDASDPPPRSDEWRSGDSWPDGAVSAERAESGVDVADRAPGLGGRVLLVEDEGVLLRVTRRVLERAGFDVIPLADCESALDFLERCGYDIDVILADLAMPATGGWTLYDRVRSAGYGGPVVLMGGSPSNGAGSRVAGDDRRLSFLPKPWSRSSLLTRMKAALQHGVEEAAG